MFGKNLKLSPEHLLLIKWISKEFGVSEEEAGYFFFEIGMAFCVLRHIPTEEAKAVMTQMEHTNPKINFQKMSKEIYESWVAGRVENVSMRDFNKEHIENKYKQ